MKILHWIKRRKLCYGVGFLFLLILCINGCGADISNKEKEAGAETDAAAVEQAMVSKEGADHQAASLSEVMERILAEQGLSKAVDYDTGIKDIFGDCIVMLCKSESGKYEAYGFISAEYGKKGIIINNIIDGADNWNYFEESWYYGKVRPALQEKGGYEVLFTFMQEKDGIIAVREIYFDTYDTGTMSVRK